MARHFMPPPLANAPWTAAQRKAAATPGRPAPAQAVQRARSPAASSSSGSGSSGGERKAPGGAGRPGGAQGPGGEEAAMGALAAALADAQAAMRGVGVTFSIQGTYALAMHGAYLNAPPDDVDFVVNNLRDASTAVLRSGKFTKVVVDEKQKQKVASTAAVHTFKHNATGAKIQLVMNAEFGVPLGKKSRDQLNGAVVLSRLEALKGLLLRSEQRSKDKLAFASLVLSYGDLLSENEKAQVVKLAGKKEWAEVVAMAQRNWHSLAGQKGAAWVQQQMQERVRRELLGLAMIYGWSHAELERRVAAAMAEAPAARKAAADGKTEEFMAAKEAADAPGAKPLHNYQDDYIS